MSYLSLRNLTMRFGERAVVDAVSLEIGRGEFFSVLGPSGCGKTTLLRLVAGFESPDAGTVILDGKDITRTPPRERGIGMVFQNYALFPHLDVYHNVAYGLTTRGRPSGDVRARVAKALASVHLSGRSAAPVSSLSGGEQQRVALARALVVEPALLLLDEPLSNLDVALRLSTREELRALQRAVGITTIYVTHDQSEALGLSDRLAVMRAGRLEQVGSPSEVYDRPATPFVAGFLGGANLLSREDVEILGGLPRWEPGAGGIVAVKPESVTLCERGSPDSLEARVVDREFQGYLTELRLQARGRLLRALLPSVAVPPGALPGQETGLRIDWARSTPFRDGGE